MNMRNLALGAAAAISLASVAQAGVIVGPVSAVIDAGGPGSGSISNTHDQSGLSAGYTSGVTDFATYIGSGPTHTTTFSGFEWFSSFGTSSATVTYDLGSVMSITKLAVYCGSAEGNDPAFKQTAVELARTMAAACFTIG